MRVRVAHLFAVLLLIHAVVGDVTPQASPSLVNPSPSGNFFLFDSFDDSAWSSRWVQSQNPKYTGRFTAEEPSELNGGAPGDKMLTLPTMARHYAASARFDRVFDPKDKPIVIQYEVRLTQGLECGGAYLKVLSASPDLDLNEVNNETPYTIMFGPDKCGFDTNKVHFIFRHRNPVTGAFEEKHLKKPPTIKTDKISHLYTLIVRPDNSFSIKIDGEEVTSGSLLEDFNPPVNPPREIDDPSDVKPADWVDEEMMPDPNAVKPADWDEDAPVEIPDPDAQKPEGWLDDEPTLVPDPSAVKPEDWDDEEDGAWEAPRIPNPKCEAVGCGKWTPPMIRNPAYKGKWTPPLIKNPAYKGKWRPRQIPNPAYFEDAHPHNMTPMAAVAVEVWTMSAGIMLNNVLVTDSEQVAEDLAQRTFVPRHERETQLLAASAPATTGGGSLQDKLQASVRDLTVMAQEQPMLLAAIASVVTVLLTTLCWCLCCRRSSAKPAPTAAPPSAEGSTAPAATPAPSGDAAAEPAGAAAPAAATDGAPSGDSDASAEAKSAEPKAAEKPAGSELKQRKGARRED